MRIAFCSFSLFCPAIAHAQVVGYYERTWAPSAPLPGASVAMAFSGWANCSLALRDSSKILIDLVGDKYITLGGGNKNGRFSVEILTDLTSLIKQGNFSEYVGIVFDVEECATVGLASAFDSAFTAAKAQNLKVVVTVSNAAPYGCADAQVLMRSFITSSNVDILSPQLYSAGNETQPNFADGGKGIAWVDYLHATGKFVPSIVSSDQYATVQGYFQDTFHIVTSGYFQWQSAGPAPAPPPTPGPAKHGNYTVQKGDGCWAIADKECHNGENWAKIICDSQKLCTMLSIGEVIKYDCSGTSKFCDSPAVEFQI
eukprot:gnl/MRDRNA2_/MRDRNA2_28830_c0_seq1.p1 gnl/MRDRNA2_/MRDRNA2_28830_c0~~gnl/MRDRNA2_/MRDRNA2_28830_c0_seq1.p1  ORF type:complete len:313 (+),score=45.81 gnl/MRDRNA2_/MRDRNA2_28830_c0_seq1:110-1048(+)